MATTETAVTQQSKQVAARRDIKTLLEGQQLKSAIAAALPRHLTAERFIRTAINATMRTPKLLHCSQESFFRCLLDLSGFGLEPDGRRAHLIPYGQTCTLVLDYKGLVELVRRSGEVSYIHADVVYKGDEWEFSYGSGAKLHHKPDLARAEDAPRIAFYSFVKLKDGSEDFIVFSPAQVERIRKRSKAADSAPWVTDYDEMGKKTVFRNHSKWLPFSSEVREAIEYGADTMDLRASAMDAADSIHASISLDDIQPSPDPNRGHNRTNSEADAEPPELKRITMSHGFPVYNRLPPKETVQHGQKLFIRENGTDTLYVYDEGVDGGRFLLALG